MVMVITEADMVMDIAKADIVMVTAVYTIRKLQKQFLLWKTCYPKGERFLLIIGAFL